MFTPHYETRDSLTLASSTIIGGIARIHVDPVTRSIIISGLIGYYRGYCAARGWDVDDEKISEWENYAIYGISD